LLDEAANVCRWRDLPNLYSHYGSRGIVLMTILQSWSQGVDTGLDARAELRRRYRATRGPQDQGIGQRQLAADGRHPGEASLGQAGEARVRRERVREPLTSGGHHRLGLGASDRRSRNGHVVDSVGVPCR
jgi:hypothetical protein